MSIEMSEAAYVYWKVHKVRPAAHLSSIQTGVINLQWDKYKCEA